VRDITERKQAEKEKREMEAQLQQSQKMEAIGTLAGGIAHDFNNALYSIIGYTELTMDDVPEGSLAQSNLKEVLNGAMRAKDMIQQILAFSRKADTVKKPIKVQSVVAESLKFLRTSIPTTIEIRQNIDADCSPILADSTQIHQVVMNLATNAYQVMREKGGVLELTLMEEQIRPKDSGPDLSPGKYLKLTVSDTGHGMGETVMETIFDPYFTTKGPGEGTGMGLAVVHGIVKDHGGDIKVHSEPGKGATFHVYLPVIGTRSVQQEAIAAGSVPTGTERILFVDDEEYLVFMTQQILGRLGYQVTSRTSSVEALEAFRAKPDEYDLVITDMTMPNMTGVELSTRLREIKPDIPILLCTGFSEMIDEDKAKNMGISAYIMKPILKDEIAGAIRRVLDKVD
jgi:nitrogen-specific signal transduction histidine kinase/CheY-like chemotaxis protein